MRILQQHELRQRGSHYFKPGRKHPFMVAFLMALMCLKQLAKKLKKKIFIIRSSYSTRGARFLREQIRRVDQTRYRSQYGGPVCTMTSIEPPVREVLQYREKRTGKAFADEELAMAALAASATKPRLPKFISRRLRTRMRYKKLVADAVNKFQTEGNTQNAGTRLQKKLAKLKLTSANPEQGGLMHRLARKVAGLSTASGRFSAEAEGGGGGGATGVTGTAGMAVVAEEPASDSKDRLPEGVVEYPPGISIYYGAPVSLQAIHGGFLSFANSKSVIASAFKVLATCKYTIIKATDASNTGIVSYGDAIWLQAGANDLLGAAYSGLVSDGTGRKLRPALISNAIENRYKASQYGRWIILNRKFPVETIGRPVGHFDSILLEQEWFYLASNSPSNANMCKLKVDVDDIMTGKVRVDLLHPPEECVWKIGMAGLASNASTNENKMAKLTDKASQQIKKSKEHRKQVVADGVMCGLEDSLDPRLGMDALKEGPLSFMQSEYLNQKHLVAYYSDMAANGFTRQPSVEFLKRLYGKESIIYKKKTEVLSMRAAQIGIIKPPIRIIEISTETPLEEADDEYWKESQRLQVSTEAWSMLNTSMARYYAIDAEKKVQAVVVMQRAVRLWLKTKFHFGRRFSALDKMAAIKWHRYFANRRRRLVLDDDSDVEAAGSSSPKQTKGEYAVHSPEDRLNQRRSGLLTTSPGISSPANLHKLQLQRAASVPSQTFPLPSLASPHQHFSSPVKEQQAHALPIADKGANKVGAAAKFCRSETNSFGLPKDVFEGLQPSVSIHSSVKYLRSFSSNSVDYFDIVTNRRPKRGTGQPSGTGSHRPQTAFM